MRYVKSDFGRLWAIFGRIWAKISVFLTFSQFFEFLKNFFGGLSGGQNTRFYPRLPTNTHHGRLLL
jgi:hypothetical protein